MKVYLIIGLLSTVLTNSGSVAAAERTGVVLLSLAICCTDHAWIEAEDAVRKEFAVLDIPVTTVDAETAEAPMIDAFLSQIAQATGADAALVVYVTEQAPQRADGHPAADRPRMGGVRIYDRVTDKLVSKRWPVGGDNADDDAMYAGLRVVDTLRASLLENQMDKQVPEPKRPPQALAKLADTTALKTDRLRQIALGIGAALGGSPKESLLLFGVTASIEWRPLRYMGLRLSLTYLPVGEQISAAGFTSDLDLLAVRGWLLVPLMSGRMSPVLFIGGGNLIGFAEGTKGDEYRLKHDVTRVAYCGGGGALNIGITPTLRIKIGVKVGAAFPEIRLYHTDVQAVRVGRPVLEGEMVLVYWPWAKTF